MLCVALLRLFRYTLSLPALARHKVVESDDALKQGLQEIVQEDQKKNRNSNDDFVSLITALVLSAVALGDYSRISQALFFLPTQQLRCL